jgi:hypothetical protein
VNKPHPKFINNPNNRLIEGMSKTQEFNKFASELSPISSQASNDTTLKTSNKWAKSPRNKNAFGSKKGEIISN